MSEITLRQSRIFTNTIRNSNDEIIGEIIFKPSDALCLGGYSKLVAIYTGAMGESQKEYEKAVSGDGGAATSDAFNRIADSFYIQAKAFDEMRPYIDETFGAGSEKLIFDGDRDMPLMFALIDWASQYTDIEANKDWREFKERAERLNAAKLNREERRAQ